jgi:hypothetical protein
MVMSSAAENELKRAGIVEAVVLGAWCEELGLD